MSLPDLLSGLAAVVLTLALLSYLVADNPLYRIATHLFIGVTAGYVALVAWYTVIDPQLIRPLVGRVLGPGSAGNSQTLLILLAGLVGGLLLMLKTVRVAGRLGTLVVALMLGVGAAVAVGGGVTGTLIPQAQATAVSILPFETGSRFAEVMIEGLFTLVGTLATLAFFYYGGQAQPGSPVERPVVFRPVAAVGQAFIGVAFGVMYAGALAASVAVFAERSGAVWSFVTTLVK
ncbi:MAG: hypothetical protein ABI847_11635 [Anaerolineales bacterium]